MGKITLINTVDNIIDDCVYLWNEFKSLKIMPIKDIDAYPDPNDIYIWYFLLKGPNNSDYENGYYFGKIKLVPGRTSFDFVMLTPNGKFPVNSKIRLINLSYDFSRQTSWNMSAILLNLTAILMLDNMTDISPMEESQLEIRIKALNSMTYNILDKEISSKLYGFERFIDMTNGTPRLKTQCDENYGITNMTIVDSTKMRYENMSKYYKSLITSLEEKNKICATELNNLKTELNNIKTETQLLIRKKDMELEKKEIELQKCILELKILQLERQINNN